ncbi:hypothetical protein BT69DRAFT_1276740 [Atractiella rhizophila]|nr:hypothetical protein BT69DRAFT_1276740 [Atractiella rhizophila]
MVSHRIASTKSGDVTVQVLGRDIVVFSRHFESILASTKGMEESHLHTGLIRQIYIHESTDGGEIYLISTGDDKLLKVWELPKLKLKSSRPLLKRANAIAVTAEGENILIGDKFGDVYQMSMNSEEMELNTSAMEGKRNLKEPIMGHVSMLTCIKVGILDGKQFIVTADRDEHVRVTEYPRAERIRGWGFGHTKFVSSVLPLPPSTNQGHDFPPLIISGGGDSFLLGFSPTSLELQSKVDISLLKGHMKVKDLRSGRRWKKRRRPNPKQPTEAEDGGDVEMKVAGEERDDSIPELAVAKMVLLEPSDVEEGGIVLFSAGSSLLLFVPRSLFHTTTTGTATASSMHVLDLAYPILDMAVMNGNQIQVLRDVSFASEGEELKDCPVVLVEAINSQLQIASINAEQSSRHAVHFLSLSASESAKDIVPTQADLYWELTVYSKRALEEAAKEDMPAEQEGTEEGQRGGAHGGESSKRKGHGKRKRAKEHLKRKFDEVTQ